MGIETDILNHTGTTKNINYEHGGCHVLYFCGKWKLKVI